MPCSASGGSTASCPWMYGSRTFSSVATICSTGLPLRIMVGPGSSEGRWTLESATQRPGCTWTYRYDPFVSGGSSSG